MRRADDAGDSAPAPIALGAALAAPGSGAAAAAAGASARDEERVAQEAGCFHDRAAVRAALAAAGGRVAEARTLPKRWSCSTPMPEMEVPGACPYARQVLRSMLAS